MALLEQLTRQVMDKIGFTCSLWTSCVFVPSWSTACAASSTTSLSSCRAASGIRTRAC